MGSPRGSSRRRPGRRTTRPRAAGRAGPPPRRTRGPPADARPRRPGRAGRPDPPAGRGRHRSSVMGWSRSQPGASSPVSSAWSTNGDLRRIACASRRSVQRSTRTPASSSAGYHRVVSSQTQRTGDAVSLSRTWSASPSTGREMTSTGAPSSSTSRASIAPSPRRSRRTRFTRAVSPRPPTTRGRLAAEHPTQAARLPRHETPGHGQGGLRQPHAPGATGRTTRGVAGRRPDGRGGRCSAGAAGTSRSTAVRRRGSRNEANDGITRGLGDSSSTMWRSGGVEGTGSSSGRAGRDVPD